jgi:hypothetical protein
LLLQAAVNASKKKPNSIFFIAAKLRLTGETGFEKRRGCKQKSVPTVGHFNSFYSLCTI